MRTLILGTAGHVDHGKTSLIGALTGTDTDRLAEEKRRGISIELGFAQLQLSDTIRLGIVDVPGHERFVRQMVAGAGGMDLALLLVAADEGVMPQTREHLDVLRLVGVSTGLVVLNKIDLLPDPELRDVVVAELEDVTEGTFLQGAPVVPVSAHTGEGIDTLRQELLHLAERAPVRRREGDFRLPVDRVFTMAGSGVVVTGTAWSGRVRNGDSLRLLPEDRTVRVRDVQSHGSAVDEAGAGERVAVAVHGVKKPDLSRGDVLVSGTGWQAGRILGIRLEAVADVAGGVRQRARYHVHHAAREVLGRLDLLEGNALTPGSSSLARLHLEEPLVARPGDRIVLRSYSPMITVGGGVVLDPVAPPRQRRADALQWLRRLETAGHDDWAWQRVAAAGTVGAARRDVVAWQTMSGLSQEDAVAALDQRVAAGEAFVVGELVLDGEVVTGLGKQALSHLRQHQEQEPLTPGTPREQLRSALEFGGSPQAFGQLLEIWSSLLPVFVAGEHVRADSASPALDDEQTRLLQAWESRIAAARPAYEASDQELHSPELAMLAGSGRVVKLGGRLIAARAVMDELVQRAAQHFAASETLEVKHVKEWTGASRKFVVPLLEWLDAHDVTRFEGGARRRGPGCPSAE